MTVRNGLMYLVT